MNKPEALNCLPIGTRIAEFEIRDVIGEGGFGIVYLAFDHSLQRTVAIKEYMPSALAARSGDQSVSVRSKRHAEAFGAGLRSFINEARLLAQFDHPALVKVYRFWEAHGTAYMAMRYYEGTTFKAVCRDNPALVTEEWLKGLLSPILGALETLYQANILHRDISPENIMIQPNGQPVLLDFGAARQIVQDMAQSLTVILKPGFAPVEQYADDESMRQGAWTDIYSLSAVMYSVIAQKAPPAAVARMLSDPIEPLAASGRPGFSTQFLDAIDRGMAVRPEIRPQTIAEFAGLLGVDPVTSETRATSRADHARLAHAAADAAGRAATKAASSASADAADIAKAAKAGAQEQAAKQAKSRRPRPREAAPAAAAEQTSKGFAVVPAPSGKSRRTVVPAGPPLRQKARPAGMRKLFGGAAALLVLALAGGAWLGSGDDVVRPAGQVAALQEDAGAPAVDAATAPSAPVAQSAAPAVAATVDNAATPAAPVADVVAAEPAPAADGTLAIAVQPWATIFVDGVERGVSPPLKKLTLPAGEHEIRLENPNFPPYVRKVKVDAKKPVTIRYDFGS